jgi:exodeoxyribonuclease VII large subunit
MDQPRRIFTLTELGKSLRSVIERNYASSYWIKAEIARLNFYPRSGHCYPELVDKTANVIQAQMRATIWAADFRIINKLFIETTGESIREGMAVLFRASVGYHPVYGLSLQIWEVEPSYTLGEMALEKSKNIARLKKEGVFQINKSRIMPQLPSRIAVISVETSKGYHDFLNILNAQAKHYKWWHYLFPSVLQGDKAAEGIMSQLRIIKKVKEKFDFVAIIRGGGGDIGLTCYDDFQLSYEIATFPIPVITGIGHATNQTVAEMVAWENKITPTDVAYFVVEKFKIFEQRLEKASNLLAEKSLNIFNSYYQKLDNLAGKFVRLPAGYIMVEKFSLENRLTLLKTAVNRTILKNDVTLDNIEAKVSLLNPSNILKRGYSLSLHNGKRIVSVNHIKPGDVVTTRLSDGEFNSKVIN